MLVTRTAIHMGENYIIHPNTNHLREYYDGDTFTETAYCKDLTFIGVYSGKTLPTLPFNFELEEKTEKEINILLLERYGADAKWNPCVYYADGKFIDNRTDDLIIND